MQFTSGFFSLGRIKGIPLRIHWSFPLLLLVMGGFSFVPGRWLGLLLVILFHELGHAFLARRTGHYVAGIDLTGVGGVCRYASTDTYRRAIVAWGGVLAQFAIAAIAAPVMFIWGPFQSHFLWHLFQALVATNLFLAALNLIPFPPLDGKYAWGLFRYLKQKGGVRELFVTLGVLKPKKPTYVDWSGASVKPKSGGGSGRRARAGQGKASHLRDVSRDAAVGDIFADIARRAEQARKDKRYEN